MREETNSKLHSAGDQEITAWNYIATRTHTQVFSLCEMMLVRADEKIGNLCAEYMMLFFFFLPCALIMKTEVSSDRWFNTDNLITFELFCVPVGNINTFKASSNIHFVAAWSLSFIILVLSRLTKNRVGSFILSPWD